MNTKRLMFFTILFVIFCKRPAAPSVVKNTSWIKPGLVSWNYWSDNHVKIFLKQLE